jgi:hypothetical protein
MELKMLIHNGLRNKIRMSILQEYFLCPRNRERASNSEKIIYPVISINRFNCSYSENKNHNGKYMDTHLPF